MPFLPWRKSSELAETVEIALCKPSHLLLPVAQPGKVTKVVLPCVYTSAWTHHARHIAGGVDFNPIDSPEVCNWQRQKRAFSVSSALGSQIKTMAFADPTTMPLPRKVSMASWR